VLFQGVPQVLKLGAVVVKVGPQGEHDDQSALCVRARGGEQVVHKGDTLGGVAAEGKELFELVDHEQRAVAVPSGKGFADVQVQAAWIVCQVVHQGSNRSDRAVVLGQAKGQCFQWSGCGGDDVHAPTVPALLGSIALEGRDQPGAYHR